jgi:hypothetical protein
MDSKVPQRAIAGETYSEVLGASRLNQVPEAIEGIKRYIQNQAADRDRNSARDQRWIGEIVDQGPNNLPNFTNATYWVKMMAVAMFNRTSDVALEEEPIPGVAGTFAVTNIQEIEDKTHRLPVGTLVEVFYPWNSKPGTELFFSKELGRLSGRVTAVASTSDAPPLKYSVTLGNWTEPTTTSQGTWVDSQTSVIAYAKDPGMIPQLVGTYVTVEFRGMSDADPPAPIYSIVGVSGPFDVYLTQVGGADGAVSTLTDATWTYDVFIDSAKTIKIAAAATVVAPRITPVETTKATRGIARINGTTVTLLQAFEKYKLCAE